MNFEQYKLRTEIENVIPNIYFIILSDQPIGTESTIIYHMFFTYYRSRFQYL